MKSLIGNTPLVEVQHRPARILAKLESYNPTGSAKDRAAAAMLEAAQLPARATVVEATSGHTGIALAALCAQRALRCIIVMPENMSRERQLLIRGYGGEVFLTPAAEGMPGARKRAEEMAKNTQNCYYANQFSNPDNMRAHYLTTGPEIWAQTEGRIDALIAGVGTGGTITGTGRFLKEQDPALQIIAVTPAPGEQISGLSTLMPLPLLDRRLISRWILVTGAQAAHTARELARTRGILVGPSAGAALFAARTLAQERDFFGKTLVAILPDTGRNDLSTGFME